MNFLRTYINIVKYLQKALWRYMHKDADLFRNIKYKTILEVFKTNHLQAYENKYWGLSCYESKIKEDRQNCLTKS